MIESLSYASEKSGMPPGSLVHVGDVHDHIQSITVINYNASLLEKHTLALADEILPIHARAEMEMGLSGFMGGFYRHLGGSLDVLQESKWL